jgi:hypothetical protein
MYNLFIFSARLVLERFSDVCIQILINRPEEVNAFVH